MKIEYSASVDALYVYLQEAAVARSVEPCAGVVVDCDASGEVIGVEILDASARFSPADAALMLADSGPEYTEAQSNKIRSILSGHVTNGSLAQRHVN